MKLRGKDIKGLIVPIAACVTLGVAAAACYFAAEDYRQSTQKQRTVIAGQRTEVQGRLDRANEEEREIKANLQQYQALAARGITAEEKRLDWIDVLTAIKNERRLFSINYNIDPQKELDYPGMRAASGVYFMSSRVKLSMQLLHEEDLLNVVDDLIKRSRLYVSVRSCDVRRAERGSGGIVLAPRLQADCVLDLITIRHTKPA
jgi:hypothetical protein